MSRNQDSPTVYVLPTPGGLADGQRRVSKATQHSPVQEDNLSGAFALDKVGRPGFVLATVSVRESTNRLEFVGTEDQILNAFLRRDHFRDVIRTHRHWQLVSSNWGQNGREKNSLHCLVFNANPRVDG